jgi:hypothetical protein
MLVPQDRQRAVGVAEVCTPKATKALAEIWNAEDKQHARTAVTAFADLYGVKWPKATAKITEDVEELLAFYDYPAEHWIHLRTSNPIESTFATVRRRTKVTEGPGPRPPGSPCRYAPRAGDRSRTPPPGLGEGRAVRQSGTAGGRAPWRGLCRDRGSSGSWVQLGCRTMALAETDLSSLTITSRVAGMALTVTRVSVKGDRSRRVAAVTVPYSRWALRSLAKVLRSYSQTGLYSTAAGRTA